MSERICSVDGCGKKHYGKGFCSGHYDKWRRTGDPLWEIPEFIPKLCCIEKCNNNAESKGFCNKHYKRFRIYGDPEFTKVEIHGMSKTPEYKTWRCMKDRCSNPATNGYKYYGGKGIEVCDRWDNSFLNFLNDMGLKPESNYQLDRIEEDKNYTPENCQWLKPLYNIRKRSYTKLTYLKAEEIREIYKSGGFSQREIAKKFNICQQNVNSIIKNKRWTIP